MTAAAQAPADRTLRRVGLICFISWACFVAAALRFEGLIRSPENHLRLEVAAIGTGIALFAVIRAGAWPRLLYLLAVGYMAYFAAASAWHGLWQVATVPSGGAAETLAVTLELAARLIAKQVASGRYALATAHAYDLAFMPVVQLVVLVYLARAVLQNR